nr:MAG TPA: hypothetical protein [Caudoviricetes sp.]
MDIGSHLSSALPPALSSIQFKLKHATPHINP